MNAPKVIAVGVRGVGQLKGVSDGIGEILDALRQMPNVTLFERRHWHNAERLASIIAHELEPQPVVFFWHSRGAVYGVKCLECLEEFGFDQPIHCYSADGWEGVDMLGRGQLHFPANVTYLEWWTQTKNRPRGSEIWTADETECVEHELGESGPGHNQMDSLPELKAAVIAAVTRKGE